MRVWYGIMTRTVWCLLCVLRPFSQLDHTAPVQSTAGTLVGSIGAYSDAPCGVTSLYRTGSVCVGVRCGPWGNSTVPYRFFVRLAMRSLAAAHYISIMKARKRRTLRTSKCNHDSVHGVAIIHDTLDPRPLNSSFCTHN